MPPQRLLARFYRSPRSSDMSEVAGQADVYADIVDQALSTRKRHARPPENVLEFRKVTEQTIPPFSFQINARGAEARAVLTWLFSSRNKYLVSLRPRLCAPNDTASHNCPSEIRRCHKKEPQALYSLGAVESRCLNFGSLSRAAGVGGWEPPGGAFTFQIRSAFAIRNTSLQLMLSGERGRLPRSAEAD